MQTYVGDLVIHDVHHPARVQKKILGILRDEGVTTTQYPATPHGQAVSSKNEEIQTEEA